MVLPPPHPPPPRGKGKVRVRGWCQGWTNNRPESRSQYPPQPWVNHPTLTRHDRPPQDGTTSPPPPPARLGRFKQSPGPDDYLGRQSRAVRRGQRAAGGVDGDRGDPGDLPPRVPNRSMSVGGRVWGGFWWVFSSGWWWWLGFLSNSETPLMSTVTACWGGGFLSH